MKTKTWRHLLTSLALGIGLAGCMAATDSEEPDEGEVVDQEEGALALRTAAQQRVDTFLTTYGQHELACSSSSGGRECLSFTAKEPRAVRPGDNFQPDTPLYVCDAYTSSSLGSCEPLVMKGHGCESGLCGCAGLFACIDMILNDCGSGVSCNVYDGEVRCLCLPG